MGYHQFQGMFKILLWKMLVINPRDRFDISQVLNHKIFKGYICGVDDNVFNRSNSQIITFDNQNIENYNLNEINECLHTIEESCYHIYGYETKIAYDMIFTTIDMFLRVVLITKDVYISEWKR